MSGFSGVLSRGKFKRKRTLIDNLKGCASCGRFYVELLPNGLCKYCASIIGAE